MDFCFMLWGFSYRRLLDKAPDASDSRSLPTCAESIPTQLDLSLLRVVYEVVADLTMCTACGARLGRRLHVASRGAVHRPSPWSVKIVTRCRGWKQHRHVASVIRPSKDLVLGALEPTRL
jgi:hypothetical protein